jgi:uncharacterized protein (TIGR02145 family)
MKTLAVFFIGSLLSLPVLAQDLNITFTATGEATVIDSVTALNMRTNQQITIPGDATLILRFTTGIPYSEAPESRMVIFPNPFSGDSRVVIGLARYQKACVTVYNLIGLPIARTEELFEPGEHEFALTVKENGIYTVVVETPNELRSSKAVCLASSSRENSLRYLGGIAGQLTKSGLQPVLNNPSGYELEYSTGDVIHYTCYSGVMTTIFTDTPAESDNHEVAFVYCTDPDGRHYKTVRIGNQTWMIENLAYLPSVSPSSNGSDTSPYYYVWGYNGTSVSDANKEANYTTYGVLYNWEAAKTACPSGWHLPSDEEWKILEEHLGMSESDAASMGWRYSGDVCKKLKSKSGWYDNGNGNNASGMCVLPGGYRYEDGGFYSSGRYAYFWSSTDHGSALAWFRYLYYGYNGVSRVYEDRRNGFSVRCLKN